MVGINAIKQLARTSRDFSLASLATTKRGRRWGCAILLTIALMGSVSACGIRSDGWIAVGRDLSGAIRVYLKTCTATMSYAKLYPAESSQGASDMTFAQWNITPPRTSADWPLLGASNGQVVVARQVNKIPAENMALGAWNSNDSLTATGPWNFNQGDIMKLKPGTLLMVNIGNGAANNQVTSIKTFNELGCETGSSQSLMG